MMNYKVASRKLNIGKRKGQKVFYAKLIHPGRIPLRVVEERITNATSLTRADVHAALIALGVVVADALSLGHSVDLGDMGLLKVSAPSRYQDQEVEVSVRSIATPVVRYYPKAFMRAAARRVELSVDNPARRALLGKKEEGGDSKPSGDSHSGGQTSPGGSDHGGSVGF